MRFLNQCNGRRIKNRRRAQRVALAVKKDLKNVSDIVPDDEIRNVIEIGRLPVQDYQLGAVPFRT